MANDLSLVLRYQRLLTKLLLGTKRATILHGKKLSKKEIEALLQYEVFDFLDPNKKIPEISIHPIPYEV